MEDYKECYNECILPVFQSKQQSFPSHLFNEVTMVNMACLLELNGAEYDFSWLDLDVAGDGLFLFN